MLDSRLRGCGFEPHQRHCVVSLFSTGSTQEDPSRHNWKIVDWDVKDQIKKAIVFFSVSFLFLYFYKFSV